MSSAPAFASGLYEGLVRHRRFAEAAHRFEYRLFMMLLDLDEIDAVCALSPAWSARRFAPAWFRRRDFLPAHEGTLREAVQAELRALGVAEPAPGPIRILTHLRYWGLSFNPISIYYCYGADGVTLQHLLLEVHNTPWNERHCYLLAVADSEPAVDPAEPGAGYTGRQTKAFHVSPFMPMDMEYRFRFNAPAQRLNFHMENHRAGARAFDATLSLRRQEITAGALNHVLIAYPWMTAKVVAGIYWEALRLLLKGVRLHDHAPATKSNQVSANVHSGRPS